MNYHPNFPYGKGMWIWYLKDCEGGDLSKVIERCKKYDISYVILKCGDGPYTWQQFTKPVIQAFQNAGIKCYSWSYIYGLDPLREASIASWALDMGVDGHVFNAEVEYKKDRLPNNEQAATIMFHKVREKHPKAFLAHAPLPIIDYHTGFPYATFGKYCDAVMPQMYWGTMSRTPHNVIQWTYEQWSKWEAKWKAEGKEDSIKPLIPLAQGYDNYEIKPAYIFNPADIKAFVDGVRGYKSVNFWSFQHIRREDCWLAIKEAKVEGVTTVSGSEKPSGIGGVSSPNTQNPPSSTPAPTVPTPSAPAQPSTGSVTPVYKHGEWHDDPTDGVNKRWWVWKSGKGSFLPKGTIEPEHAAWYVNPDTGVSQRFWRFEDGYETFLDVNMTDPTEQMLKEHSKSVEIPTNNGPVTVPSDNLNNPVKPSDKPQETGAPAKVEIPKDGKATIDVKPNPSAPGGVELKIHYHKKHVDILLELIAAVKAYFSRSGKAVKK